MSSKSPKDYEIPDKEAGARMDAQPQKHFGSPNGEDAIPWAEIILEDEPFSPGEVTANDTRTSTCRDAPG